MDQIIGKLTESIQASGVKVMILSSDYEKAKEIVDNYFRNMNNATISEEL
jgi:hypothetical protein